MSNPYPGEALFPAPGGSAGWNLWRMSGLSLREYVTQLDRRNLMAHWIEDEAAEAARAFHFSLAPSSSVLVLGQSVRKALGLPRVLVHPVVADGVAYRQIPHPSGRNPFYNDPTNRAIVRMLLRWLIEESRTATSG